MSYSLPRRVYSQMGLKSKTGEWNSVCLLQSNVISCHCLGTQPRG